jgi:hypothetical protein
MVVGKMKNYLLSLLLFPAVISSAQAKDENEGPPAYFGKFDEVTGLTGNLYDLKNTPDREFTEVAPNGKVIADKCYEVIEDLAKKGFRQKDLDEYRIGDTICDLKTLAFISTNASAAPLAFGSPEIDPTGIIIVYEGVIDEAPDEEIRFGGWFDDCMMVLVNGKVVFYTAWYENKTRYKSKEYGNLRKENIKRRNGSGDSYGEYIELKKGDTFQIVVAEIPGGKIGGVLKVQIKDKSYKEDKHDDPILHPFVAGKLSRDERKALESSRLELKLTQIPEFTFATGESE